MNGKFGLFFALSWHAGANLRNEPALEFLAGFQNSTADDQGIRIKGIDHFVEEEPQSVGLHAENILAQRVTFIREAAHGFGCLVRVLFC